MQKTIVLLLCLGLCGCATAGKLNSISIGMSKADVLKIMGTPFSTSATKDQEYLKYLLVPTSEPAQWANYQPYFVCIKEGKVAAFGKEGDFGTTEQTAQVIKIISDTKSDQKIDVQMNNSELETKLKTISKLLTDGLITKSEFDEQKKKLLYDYTSKK